jgi:hypothetical protein
MWSPFDLAQVADKFLKFAASFKYSGDNNLASFLLHQSKFDEGLRDFEPNLFLKLADGGSQGSSSVSCFATSL